jgi:hypothetical protein
MNLNDDVVYRCRPLGPLHQLHASRTSGLIGHHNRLHRAPSCVEFSPERRPIGGTSTGFRPSMEMSRPYAARETASRMDDEPVERRRQHRLDMLG